MFNLFNQETQEAMLQLINKQAEMIALQKEAIQERDELLVLYRQLVEVKDQEMDEKRVKIRGLKRLNNDLDRLLRISNKQANLCCQD